LSLKWKWDTILENGQRKIGFPNNLFQVLEYSFLQKFLNLLILIIN
jgi:hypothetical protein